MPPGLAGEPGEDGVLHIQSLPTAFFCLLPLFAVVCGAGRRGGDVPRVGLQPGLLAFLTNDAEQAQLPHTERDRKSPVTYGLFLTFSFCVFHLF